MRAGKLWSQIESTFKKMDTAGTELECFRALQKQEQLAASHRINNMWEEVQKQKELERTLQKRYGDLIADTQKIQHLMDEYRIQDQMQEEVAAKNRALELAKAEMAEKDSVPSADDVEPSGTGQNSNTEENSASASHVPIEADVHVEPSGTNQCSNAEENSASIEADNVHVEPSGTSQCPIAEETSASISHDTTPQDVDGQVQVADVSTMDSEAISDHVPMEGQQNPGEESNTVVTKTEDSTVAAGDVDVTKTDDSGVVAGDGEADPKNM